MYNRISTKDKSRVPVLFAFAFRAQLFALARIAGGAGVMPWINKVD
jgi:hypothetical protein